MRLEGLELRRVQLPLVAPFTTAFGSQSVRDVVIVRALTDLGEGWGECATMPWPLYSSESTDLVIPLMTAHLAPRLLAVESLEPSDVGRLLADVQGHRMAKAALESAVMDAWLRGTMTSFAEHLGVTRTRIPCGVSVGIPSTVTGLVDEVGGYLEAGYQRIKLKIRPGWDLEPVGAVRRAFGPDVPLQVDANASYHPSDIGFLARLDLFDLLMVEQPFAADRLMAHADLAAAVRTPVCLDESATSCAVVADAIRLRAVDVVNIKPGRVGGFAEAVRMHDLCRAHAVPVWCGGMVETGIGRAANTVLAALDGFTLVGDNSPSDRFFAEDVVTRPMAMVDGHLEVPQSPGMGFEVDRGALAAATVQQVQLDRSGR